MEIAPRRGRNSKPSTPINSGEQWSQLGDQQRLQARNHTAAENAADRQGCRDLIAGGYGSDADFTSWLNLFGQQ